MPRRKDKKRKQRRWGNDSVERLQKRLAGLEAARNGVAAKLERLQDRDREVTDRYQKRGYGEIASIAEYFGLSRSAVHQIVKRQLQLVGSKQGTQFEPGAILPEPVVFEDASDEQGSDEEAEDEADPDVVKPDYEQIKEQRDDLHSEYYDVYEAIEDWMRRLREQAARDQATLATPDGRGSATSARFLTDMAWEMEKWVWGMETYLRELATST